MVWVLMGPANNGPKSLWREEGAGSYLVSAELENGLAEASRLEGSGGFSPGYWVTSGWAFGAQVPYASVPRAREKVANAPIWAKEVRPWQMVTTTSLST